MSDTSQFERDQVCYEQNCEQMRSLNQIMWQVPIVAMTLTGGLWYAVATITSVDNVARIALLAFSAVANTGLTLMINRVRDVLAVYLKKMKEFNPAAFADASSTTRRLTFLRDRGVCRTFSYLMMLAAIMSAVGALLIATGCWVPDVQQTPPVQ
jgi:hypothetical protein